MLLTAKDAATRLNIKLSRFYHLVRTGALPLGVVVRFGERQIRVHEGRLDQWIENGGQCTRQGALSTDESRRTAALSNTREDRNLTKEDI